jgi:hypothetical protein
MNPILLTSLLISAYFRHPAYEDPCDILIIHPGLDHAKGGIHHHTVLVTCVVITNISLDGWLTEDQYGKVRVTVPSDGIFRKQNYYFHVSSDHRGTAQKSREKYVC